MKVKPKVTGHPTEAQALLIRELEAFLKGFKIYKMSAIVYCRKDSIKVAFKRKYEMK